MEPTLLHAVHSLQRVAPAIAGVVVASAWESIFLVGATALLLRLLREASPERRTLVWTAVLVLLLLLPALAFDASHQHGATVKTVHVLQGYSFWFAALWLLASVTRLGLLGRQLVHLAGVRRRAVPVRVAPEVEAMLRSVRGAGLYVSPEVSRPCLAGLLRPRVLFPEGMLAELTSEELRQVLFHEMEHLRRWDDWLNLLQQLSLVLLPLNPALIWLDHQLSRERELACDDGVLRRGAAAKGYAAVLVRLAELSMAWRGTALALSLLGPRKRGSELGSRVQRLLSGGARSTAAESRWSVPCAALLAACFAATLALCPQWVQFDRLPASYPALAAEAVPARTGAQGEMIPVVARPAFSAAAVRTIPVRATLAHPRPLRRAVWSTGSHRSVLSMRSRVRAVVGVAPRTRMAASPRIMLTGFEFSQSVYAAVPVEGGWLVVQL